MGSSFVTERRHGPRVFRSPMRSLRGHLLNIGPMRSLFLSIRRESLFPPPLVVRRWTSRWFSSRASFSRPGNLFDSRWCSDLRQELSLSLSRCSNQNERRTGTQAITLHSYQLTMNLAVSKWKRFSQAMEFNELVIRDAWAPLGLFLVHIMI